MSTSTLKSIARSFDRAVTKGPDAVDRHMCTVFRSNPSQWSRAVDKYSEKLGERWFKEVAMTDREEAEFREEYDGLFDNMDRDEIEDFFEGDD